MYVKTTPKHNSKSIGNTRHIDKYKCDCSELTVINHEHCIKDESNKIYVFFLNVVGFKENI